MYISRLLLRLCLLTCAPAFDAAADTAAAASDTAVVMRFPLPLSCLVTVGPQLMALLPSRATLPAILIPNHLSFLYVDRHCAVADCGALLAAECPSS